MRIRIFLTGIVLFFSHPFISEAQQISEILGRPTSSSVTINTLSGANLEIFREYGTVPGMYNLKTDTLSVLKDVPVETEIKGLSINTRYFYRTRTRTPGSLSFTSGPEHSFQTPRPAGTVFSFALEADPHLDSNSIPEAYSLTLQNILSKNPDFLLDLGDTFMSEKQSPKTQEIVTQRHLLLRSFFDKVCHSIPLFLIQGNHEGEQGWMLTGSENSFPVMVTKTRKLYFPNPFPNSYYSGSTKEEPFVGLRENYYAFEWGDALFVVLDPYWYTPQKADWGWTLGVEQYNWFKKTLTESRAKFKFVFCHTLVGGNTSDARGGAEFAHLFEMGGSNTDGSWGFDTNRPGWKKPIHTLMVENHVTAFFHGHDHFFGKQEKDGVVYQEVPQPSNRSLTNISATEYGYVKGDFLPGRGYLLVIVSPDEVKIDYIKTYLPSEENATQKNGEVAYSYTVKSQTTGMNEDIQLQPVPCLEQNRPNPFPLTTSIHYRVDQTLPVRLRVFDTFGREVADLVSKVQEPGFYTQTFDPVKYSLPNGIYYAHLTSGNISKSIRMVYINNTK
jgi:DNA repair exonuclease SbcCD nuclease subunit